MRRLFSCVSLLCLSGAFLLTPVECQTLSAAEKPKPEFLSLAEKGTVRFDPAEAEGDIPEPFRQAAHDFEYVAQPMEGFTSSKASKIVRMSKVTFPSPVETEEIPNRTVHAEYFQPAGKGPFPAVVVLHILGGDFVLSETIANHLARNGIAAMFVKMPYYGERRSSGRRMISKDPHETVLGMTQGVLDIRRAAAWLSARPEVDKTRLGITGISLGGIMSALAGGIEPRFTSVAIYLGGGNFAEIVWNRPEAEAVEFREKWLAAGGTRESFAAVLNQVDPLTYGPRLKGRRVLFVAAKNDEVIPPACSVALYESIGKEPQMVWLDAGHYTAARFLPLELMRLHVFFQGKTAIAK